MDEGPAGNQLEWLPMVIDSRRRRLCLDDSSSLESVEEIDGQFRFIGDFGNSFPDILNGPILSDYEPDTEYTIGGYSSPYEEIGLRLVNFVEDREAAATSPAQRMAAQEQLDQFLGQLSIKVGGRPTILRDPAANKIFDQGSKLLKLCCRALAVEISLTETTKKILASYAVLPSDMVDWAIRLSLPNFSALELRALLRCLRGMKHEQRRSVAFEHEFTAHLMAHRLRTHVALIARKVMCGWDAEMVETSGEECLICELRHA